MHDLVVRREESTVTLAARLYAMNVETATLDASRVQRDQVTVVKACVKYDR